MPLGTSQEKIELFFANSCKKKANILNINPKNQESFIHMPASEHRIAPALAPDVIYAVEPPLYKAFLLRVTVYNAVTMFRAATLYFPLEPLFVNCPDCRICFFTYITVDLQ